MKHPDLELLHQLKGDLEQRLEDMIDGDLKSRARQHLCQSLARAERRIEEIVSGAVDDIYYINEVLEAVETDS